MKKLLFIIAFAMPYLSLYSQDNNSWIYKTSFEPINDSLTKVYVDLNTRNLPDSSNLFFTISTELGKNNLLLRKEVYTSSIVNGQDIQAADFGFKIYLGQFVVKPELPFIVDLVITPKGQDPFLQ